MRKWSEATVASPVYCLANICVGRRVLCPHLSASRLSYVCCLISWWYVHKTFLWACRLRFHTQGQSRCESFKRVWWFFFIYLFIFAVSPVNERKEMSRTAPLVERVPFSDDVWLPIIQPDFDRGKGGGGLMSNAERCNLQQTFVQLRVTHTESEAQVRLLRFVQLWQPVNRTSVEVFHRRSEAGLCLCFARVRPSVLPW